jgi:hypothetical protein
MRFLASGVFQVKGRRSKYLPKSFGKGTHFRISQLVKRLAYEIDLICRSNYSVPSMSMSMFRLHVQSRLHVHGQAA